MNIKNIICGLCCLVLLAACRHGGDMRSKEDSTRLSTIDDSVAAMSPKAKDMILHGLATATDSMMYYEYVSRLGKYYCLSATPDSMTIYINKVVDYVKSHPATPRSNSLLAYVYNTQGANYHNFHKKGDDAVGLYHEAYRLLAESDTKDQMPVVCANLGDAYVFKNQLPEAAYWYRRALFLVDSLRLPKEEDVTLYMGLAHIYLLLNDFDSALKYYRQTECHYVGMSPAMKSYFLNNYGNYYYYAKDYKASLAKFLQLEKMLNANGMGDTFNMFLCKVNLADVYLNLGEIGESEKCLAEVEDFIRKNNDPAVAYYCNTIRIGQAVKTGKMAMVGKVLDSEKISGDIEFPMRKIRNQYLRKYYEAIGDYKSAYANLVEDNSQNDSLEHRRIKMRASEIMERFAQDTLLLHHRIAMEHKNAEIQRSRSLIMAVVGSFVILALLVALYVIHSHRKSEKAKLNIMQLKLTNVRNRISPHFIFNVLNNKIINSNAEDAGELLELAKLIRDNLDMSCRLEVPLRDELAFVEKYVAVERRLIADGLEFNVNVDDSIDLDATMIPSMMVQILAENALVHGLSGWNGYKRLDINVGSVEGRICFSVRDNGHGFDATTMARKQRTGLNIIRQTIAVLNETERRDLRFQLRNVRDEKGNTVGCEGILTI